jgi:hypothetical protein
MTSGEIPSGPVVLFLRLDPSWVFIDELRRFVESFCAAACPGAEREEQLALAAHELVQNALSYACAPGVELRCEVDRSAGSVRVSVTNAAEPEQADRLRARVVEVSGYADALAGYVAAMRKAPRERGGLGLARVRFEASLDLAVEAEGARVTVHAVGPLAPADGSPSAGSGRGFAAA